MSKIPRTGKTHIFFLFTGGFVVWWGFASIDDSIGHPLYMGASWQAGALIVLLGGMIGGVAINNILKAFSARGKSKS